MDTMDEAKKDKLDNAYSKFTEFIENMSGLDMNVPRSEFNGCCGR